MEFEEYVAARGRALERYAFVLTGDAQQSQDLVQTALLNAYRHWRRVARAEHPDAYVRRIVTTSYLDWRRRRSSTEEPVADPAVTATAPDPADQVAARDEVLRALAALSPHQRAVLVLRHYEGYDDAAIAAVLGCGDGTVRSHATRGTQRLRTLLADRRLPEEP